MWLAEFLSVPRVQWLADNKIDGNKERLVPIKI